MEKEQAKTKSRAEEPTTIGALLRSTRLSQKKTIENVCKALCIRKIYIKAIEESDFNELTPIPYGVGFVRSYANYLGLNADRIVQCYKEEAMPTTHQPVTTCKIVKKHSPVNVPNRKQILGGVGVFLAFYILWLIFSPKPQEPEVLTAEPETIAEVQMEEEQTLPMVEVEAETLTPEENPVLSAEPEEVAEEPVDTQASRVVLKVTGESWIEVRDDERVYLTGIYKKGFVFNVPDKSGIRLSIGRFNDVDVYIDGKATTVAGPSKKTNISLDRFLNH